MKRIEITRSARIIAIAIGVAGVGSLSPLTATAASQSVSFCHMTQSEHNPAVAATISSQGLINGHLGHPEDIIPPFTYNGVTYSQNWNDAGIAIYENGCSVPGEVVD